MSEEIFFSGVKYISASEAAEICNLTRDYVARLAREGKIESKRLGRNWYVSEASLKDFLIGLEYNNILRRQELARDRKEEYKARAAAQAGAVSSIAQAAGDVHRKVTNAAVKGTAQLASTANTMLANTSGHIPLYAVSPGFELLHKVVAAVLGILFFVGVYAMGDALIKSSPSYTPGTAGTPSREIAAIGGLTSNTFSSLLSTMQRGVYAFLAPFLGTQNATPQSIVAVQITAQPITSQTAPVSSKPKTSTIAQAVSSVQPTTQVTTRTIVQQPVIQKIYETQPLAVSGGVSEDELNVRLQQLENDLVSQIFSATAANSTEIAQNYNVTAQTNAIDQLTNTTITNPTISGGSISGTTLSDVTLTGTTSLDALTLGTPLLQTSGGTGISSYAPGDLLYANASGTLTTLGVGGNGQVLKISGGLPNWGTDITGSGGAGAWATSTNSEFIYPSDATNVVVIGNTATTTTNSILEVTGNTFLRGALTTSATSTASVFVATSTATSTFGGGINLTSGCFSVNGTCITTGGSGSSNVSTSSQNTWSALQIFAGNASSS
ncbi:MAG TPA: helix-turn-helix domain-containing protein, partial [Candidatus Paceibacterota bacterium]|nr:helix-turn-helix domain-containing protein [Candidatus Paceibacterota bacterium]